MTRRSAPVAQPYKSLRFQQTPFGEAGEVVVEGGDCSGFKKKWWMGFMATAQAAGAAVFRLQC